jgi:hypothetical protein
MQRILRRPCGGTHLKTAPKKATFLTLILKVLQLKVGTHSVDSDKPRMNLLASLHAFFAAETARESKIR